MKKLVKKKVVRRRKNSVIVAGSVKNKNVIPKTSRKKLLKYDAISCTQNGTTFYMATVNVELLKHFKLDIYDHKTGTGWNRYEKLELRGDNFCYFMEQPGSYCPVAIITNDRGNACSVKKVNGRIQLQFDTSAEMFVTEGQGRTNGLLKMLQKGIYTEVPIIVTKGPISEEIRTGWTINHKRTNVSANMKICQSHRIVIDHLHSGIALKDIDKKIVIEAVSFKVISMMNAKRRTSFYKAFIMPNEDLQSRIIRREKFYKKKTDKSIMHNVIKMSNHAQSSCIPSITKRALKLKTYRSLTNLSEDVFEVVMAFWMAMEDINPTIFKNASTLELKKKKTDQYEILLQGYHTQVRNGCFLLYPILAALLQKGCTTKREFKKYLSKSSILKDVEYWEDNRKKRDGAQILGSRTWDLARLDILNEMGMGLK